MSEISTEWKELRPKIGNFICHADSMSAQIDAKVKTLQEKEEHQANLQSKIDEAYYLGIQELYDALGIFAEMPEGDIIDMFGTMYLNNIIRENTPRYIIYKLNQWKADKNRKKQENQEFHVGDEIICISEYSLDYNKTFIYLGRTEHYMKMFDLNKMKAEYTNNFVDYRKTGKHYDSIPLPKEIK